ncbi:hypothetical protein [Streptomyces orinoci]|uniref:Uncharacterized protein n=1 Tax=Streptomyces orinoci TaxID=67339 RepID=A0ABV3JXW3_STRON|nr:hypothetical protein [Streptomyces orinoci]
MANPHQQSPEGNYDPAGSTQMFRAFVDEGAPGPRASAPAARARSGGPSTGVIAAVLVALAAVAVVVWLAVS